MESVLDPHTARALLDWQIELGATEAIGDAPVDRYALSVTPAAQMATPVPRVTNLPVPEQVDPVATARAAATAAANLVALRASMDAFEHCELRKGARNLVFADGNPGARVMIVGEAPGRDEDIEGRPFVGRAGQMLDLMLAEIGLSRESSVYITNVLPWRPPQNREPRPDEIAMLRPFLERHIELVAPAVLIAMGNISCDAILGKRGITRMRGNWKNGLGLPVMPMFHPAYLLRNRAAKRAAWCDLLNVRARLDDD